MKKTHRITLVVLIIFTMIIAPIVDNIYYNLLLNNNREVLAGEFGNKSSDLIMTIGTVIVFILIVVRLVSIIISLIKKKKSGINSNYKIGYLLINWIVFIIFIYIFSVMYSTRLV